jgi:hypothetical protein
MPYCLKKSKKLGKDSILNKIIVHHTVEQILGPQIVMNIDIGLHWVCRIRVVVCSTVCFPVLSLSYVNKNFGDI